MTDMKLYMQNRRIQRRNKLLELSGNLCKKCGSIEKLQFDHRNPEEKIFTLSGSALDRDWDSVLSEHQKCDLLCFNCHKEKSLQNGDYGTTPWNKGTGAELIHGTARCYIITGCRCTKCALAKKQYRNNFIGYNDQPLVDS